jgi:hypothetical protein
MDRRLAHKNLKTAYIAGGVSIFVTVASFVTALLY